MPRFANMMTWAGVGITDPAVLVAQHRELQRNIPILYTLLVVNGAAVAYTHYSVAPLYLTVGVAGLLFVACGLRLIVWVMRRKAEIDAAAAHRQLKSTTILAVILSAGYIFWALSLDQYGDSIHRSHVAIYIAITTIGVFSCLTHLPKAATVVAFIVNVPFTIHYARLGEPVFVAITVNILLVSIVLLYLTLANFQSFLKLIRSQADLATKQIETQRLSQENARLANTDSLTGLPNRRHFFAELDSLIEVSGRAGKRFAVGVLDLDRFKIVNDVYGHGLGDRLLAEVGRRVNALLNVDDRVEMARLGGDEFGYLVRSFSDEGELSAIGQRFCDALSQPFLFDELKITIGCSCGVSIFPQAGTTAHLLFDRADYALYHSKSTRRGLVTIFSDEHETSIRSTLAIERALQIAPLECEMEVHFQPIVQIATGETVCVEALARWTNPALGAVRPDQFIAVAERAGMIDRLTLLLLRKALVHAKTLPVRISLSFNLSSQDITSPETMVAVMAIVNQSGIDPKRIVFELTETSVMRNFEVAVSSIRALRTLGTKVALDDFGTGYSSLSYLHRLSVDKVKVDRSFIAEIDTASGRDILVAVLGLCENLKLECVIEGVETTHEMTALKQIGYQLAQGYWYARPMPFADFMAWNAASANRSVVQTGLITQFENA